MSQGYDREVATAIVVSDLPSLRSEIRAMIESPSLEILEASSGPELARTLQEYDVDLAILDLQVGSMGAMAMCLDLRHEESYGAAEHVPVLMLLDRRADVFLARRSGAEGFVVKPLDPQRIRRAVRQLLDGGRFEDESWRPATVRVGASSPR